MIETIPSHVAFRGLRIGMVIFLLLFLADGNPVAYGKQYVVVVLDDSGSMDDSMRTAGGRVRRIDAAKTALVAVLENLPQDTQVGVLALNSRLSGSNWIVPLGSGNRDQWAANIRQLRADGGTPLGEFMKIGADALLKARADNIYGSYRLLIVTDGEANDARVVEQYLPDILSRGLVIDVIGVDMDADHSLATRVHSYRRADDDRGLRQAISDVFAETSSNDQDAEAGFELVAALPDGFAEGAIQALSAKGNQPIAGEAASAGGFTIDGGSINRPNVVRDVVGTLFGTLVCCFGGIVAVIVLASVILKKRR